MLISGSFEFEINSYAPSSDKFLLLYTFLTGSNFCLVKAITLGPFLFDNASSHDSAVSIVSAGLNTFTLGVALNDASCSIG